MRYFTPTRMAKLRRQMTASVSEGGRGKLELAHITGGQVKRCSRYGKQSSRSSVSSK